MAYRLDVCTRTGVCLHLVNDAISFIENGGSIEPSCLTVALSSAGFEILSFDELVKAMLATGRVRWSPGKDLLIRPFCPPGPAIDDVFEYPILDSAVSMNDGGDTTL